MVKFILTAGAVGLVAATAVGWAGPAAAAPSGTSSAGDTIKSLQAQGYNVQVNGSVTAPLSECLVTGVHGVPASGNDSTQFTTVYVDVSCPPSNN
ncbi:MAG: hypothetical protein JO191_10455 [Mycobacteriaceae bacterium]|nr:hypothetical protein [Mycobacteriaceae bacterium]MBV9515002.1 hypothetical protein [Mycobacteriaceae bacterium]